MYIGFNIPGGKLFLFISHYFIYSKVANSRLSLLVPHLRIFRLFMKGKFDAYVQWPVAKRVQNWIVDRSTARVFTVLQRNTCFEDMNISQFSQYIFSKGLSIKDVGNFRGVPKIIPFNHGKSKFCTCCIKRLQEELNNLLQKESNMTLLIESYAFTININIFVFP